MKKRRLGRTELELTTVGFGAWAAGGGGWAFGWGPQDDEETLAALKRALDAGIDWFDTAPVYGLGHSEEVVGRFLKGMSSKPLIATKCGLVWNDKGDIGRRLRKASVKREMEASLRRLGLDHVDLYQMHWPDPDRDIEEGWSAMAELVGEGKARFIGVSNFSVSQLERVLPIHPVASLQPPYSMIRRGVEDELLGFCAGNGIGIVAYSPMQNGLLTGKYDRERIAALPDEDWRKTKSPHFREPELSANLRLLEGLKPVAEKAGRSLAQLSIAWTLRRPEVTSAIVGARRPSQVEETAPAGDWELGEPELERVAALLQKREQALASA